MVSGISLVSDTKLVNRSSESKDCECEQPSSARAMEYGQSNAIRACGELWSPGVASLWLSKDVKTDA